MGFGGTQDPTAPPRARVVFVEAAVETKKATRTGSRLTFEGIWCFTLRLQRGPRNAAAITRARRAYLAEVEHRRYKIGIKLKQAQTVDTFSFRGTRDWFHMVPDAAVTNALTTLYPTDPEDKWVGFTPPAGVRRRPTWRDGLTVCYRFRIAVSPLMAPPQAVTSVITYADLAIDRHHLKSVLLLSDLEKTIRTATRALVP
jgi:hypothetical protein